MQRLHGTGLHQVVGSHGCEHLDALTPGVGEDEYSAALAAPGELGLKVVVAFQEAEPGADCQIQRQLERCGFVLTIASTPVKFAGGS